MMYFECIRINYKRGPVDFWYEAAENMNTINVLCSFSN